MNVFTKVWNWMQSLFGNKASSNVIPAAPGWNITWSSNVPPQMTAAPDGSFYFDFPQSDGVHYVTKPAAPLALGQTITMHFAIVGDGHLIATDGGVPAHVRIMIQQRGDNMVSPDARWWSAPIELKAPGEYVLTAPVVFDKWITIGGGLPTAGATGFANCVAGIGNIGFTFGGWSAGHGVYAQGASRFILKSFTIT